MKMEPHSVTVQYRVQDSDPIDVTFTNDNEFTTNNLTSLKVPQNREQFIAAISIADSQANGQLTDINNIVKYL